MKSKNYNLKIKSKILNSAISDASKNLNKITFHDEYTDYSNSLTYSSIKNNSNTLNPKEFLSNSKNKSNQILENSFSIGQNEHDLTKDKEIITFKKIVFQRTNSSFVKKINDTNKVKKPSIIDKQIVLTRNQESVKIEKKKKDWETKFNFDSQFLRSNRNPLKAFINSTISSNEEFCENEKKKSLKTKKFSTKPDLKNYEIENSKFEITSNLSEKTINKSRLNFMTTSSFLTRYNDAFKIISYSKIKLEKGFKKDYEKIIINKRLIKENILLKNIKLKDQIKYSNLKLDKF